uniref:Major facilitator superfamily (MFS) profile domain-containing protein n=1 Tax=Panagrolaimus davidi TaxID=227884 RepID=A0A914QXM5_9BILA
MVSLTALIAEYRNNRKILLLIVYVALFLDNMLLTTVVPIIPEYLLRIQYPNETDMILNKIPEPQLNTRGKRQINWDSAWDLPEPPPKLEEDDDDDDSPRPRNKGGKAKSKGTKSRSKTTTKLPKENPKEQSQQPMTQEQRDKYMEEQRQYRHEALSEENVHVGLMFGSKALVQLITNPFIGPVTNKIGYTVPMFTGFVVMFLSTLMFAFGSSYGMLWFARALQGIGSACTSTSGMGMLAQAYPDDAERGSAMGMFILINFIY